MLLPFFLWSQRSFVAVGGDITYVGWYPAITVLDMNDGWKPTVVGVSSVPSFGGHVEYSLDDTWTLFARLTVFPSGGPTLFLGDLNFRWYGSTPAPEGVSVGGGFLFFQAGPYISLYPQLLASYKWVVGKHFFLEPEVSTFLLYYGAYLGMRVSLSAGWMF